MNRVVAIMSMGQLWCPEHCEYDDTDVAGGHVTPITEFDVACGTPEADWLADGCCHVCGVTWGQKTIEDAQPDCIHCDGSGLHNVTGTQCGCWAWERV